MSRSFWSPAILAVVVAAFLAALPVFVAGSPTEKISRRNNNKNAKPNFVYLLADDQDATLAHPEFMPLLHKYIGSKGVNYTNFYAPVSQCCPSRVGFTRGQQGHSHNITFVSAPYGGYDVFDAFGYNGDWIFSWLQDVGYTTMYSGKLMNGNNMQNAQSKPLKGFDESAILLDPTTYSYTNSSYSFNSGAPVHYPNDYSTDRIRDFGLEHIEKAAQSDKPFFIGIAPIGPHTTGQTTRVWTAPTPAERHKNLFNDYKVPRSGSFNPDRPSGVSWLRDLAQMNQTLVDYVDDFYRDRLRATQAVDELVAAVVKKLDDLDLLDNTYIMYSADNGFTVGEHRRLPGKTTGYEEDIRVPFVVRGPGISAGEDRFSAHSNIDITATILHLAGAGPTTFDIDGRVMPWGDRGASKKDLGSVSHQLSEFWAVGASEGDWSNMNNTITYLGVGGTASQANNTYRVLRLIEENQNWAYAVWCTGERELYNMQTDSLQMENLLEDLNNQGRFAWIEARADATRLASRLDALVLYLKFCHGTTCRFSWSHLFPNGEAKTLEEALNPRFDSYFNSLPKVQYNTCRLGFHLELEFPYWTTDMAYSARMDYGDGDPTDSTLMRAIDPRSIAWWELDAGY